MHNMIDSNVQKWTAMFEGKRLSNQKLKVAVSMTALSKNKKEFIMRVIM